MFSSWKRLAAADLAQSIQLDKPSPKRESGGLLWNFTAGRQEVTRFINEIRQATWPPAHVLLCCFAFWR